MDPLSIIGGIASAGAKLFGASQDRDAQQQSQDKNIALQREFAQNGIQWKVQDALKAGIHPLFAMGANTTSFAPVSVGSSGMSEAMGSAGQDISRALTATATSDTKSDMFTKTVQSLTVQKMGLENELLGSQIAKLKAAQMPSMPSATQQYLLDGQGPTAIPGTSIIKEQPLERGITNNQALHQEVGALQDQGFARTATGYMPVLPKHLQERLEDDHLGMLAWNLRNRILPTFGLNRTPPAGVPLTNNQYWTYPPWAQEYRRANKSHYYSRGGSE